jgi:hypothetical protein
MVRTLKGHYVKTNSDEGIGYVMFKTRTKAKEWVEAQGLADCFVVPVRTAITPTDTGRTERMVALHKAKSKAVSQAQQEFRF